MRMTDRMPDCFTNYAVFDIMGRTGSNTTIRDDTPAMTKVSKLVSNLRDYSRDDRSPPEANTVLCPANRRARTQLQGVERGTCQARSIGVITS